MSTLTALGKRPLDRLSTYRTGGRAAGGTPLPPLRLRAGGAYFRDNAAFVEGGRRDARRLAQYAHLSSESAILDIGCGAGRLAVGVWEEIGPVRRYLGIDVSRDAVDWDRRHLSRQDPRMQFRHLDIANDRYNRNGHGAAASTTLPVDADAFDVVYAYSVFSHMRGSEVAHYLHQVRRALREEGIAMFTAFVERDVPEEEVNPTDYGQQAWQGALHCVRFKRGYFEAAIATAGLGVHKFEHGGETDGQSLYIVRPSAASERTELPG
jgi:cyclopropane fatty-acyl-phospholipid synthase-like methyltransferase